MKQYLRQISQLLRKNYEVSISEEDLKQVNEIVLKGNQSNLFHIEHNLCVSQKQNCIDQLHFSFDKYYHEGMPLDDVKSIVTNVLKDKAPTPEITDTVSFLLAE